jgi:HlyD family secretion protein
MQTEQPPELETKLLSPADNRYKSASPVVKQPSWLWLAVVVGLGSLGFGTYYAITRVNGDSATPPVVNVEPVPTQRAISALGRIEPEGEVIRLASPSALGTARVAQLLVKEGDQVQVNQVLARLDSYDRSLAELLSAQSQVQEYQSRLAQVQAGAKQGDILAQERQIAVTKANLSRIQAEYANAQLDRQRYEQLFQEGAVSATVVDSFRTRERSLLAQVNQAQQQISQAQAQLSSIAEVRPTDIALAESQLQTALVNVRRAEVNLELSQVRAPIAGQILKIHSKVGENVSMTDGLLEIGNTKQMVAVAEVYETDIGQVRVGQRAEIFSEAFAGTISGTVTSIGLRVAKNDILSTDPAARTDVRVVEVRIRLDDSAKVAKLTNLQVQTRIFP